MDDGTSKTLVMKVKNIRSYLYCIEKYKAYTECIISNILLHRSTYIIRFVLSVDIGSCYTSV